MDETFDDFSEAYVNQGGAFILPPSSSHTVAEATRFAAEVLMEVDNLAADESDERVEEAYLQETEVVGAEGDNDEETFDASAEDGEHSATAPDVSRHTVYLGGAGDDDDDGGDGFGFGGDDDDVVDVEAGEHRHAEGADDNEEDVEVVGVQGGDDVVEVRPAGVKAPPASGDKSGGAPSPPFALSRVKALFRYFNELSSREMTDETGRQAVLCSLSTDAAELLAEATALMIQDLVNSASAETKRHNKKTVSYDDVAFVASQLDRFSFMSDLLRPVANVAPRKAQAGAPAGKAAPPAPSTSSGKSKAPTNSGGTKSAANRGHAPQPDPRQRTLDFSKIARSASRAVAETIE